MLPVARVNDLVHGHCDGPGHVKRRPFKGVFVTGSDVAMADSLQVCVIGSVGVTDCGHHFRAITGSDVAGNDGMQLHRVGDLVEVVEGGEGVTITGSDILYSD